MRFLTDMDGTIAGFEAELNRRWQLRWSDRPLVSDAERTVAYLAEEPGHEEWAEDLWAIPKEPGFYLSLQPFPGAVDTLNLLVQRGHEVLLVSTPMFNPHCAGEKFAWIHAHLGAEWLDRIVLCRDKSVIQGDVMIDDWPKMRGEERATWTRVIYDAPYNQAIEGPRLYNWLRPESVVRKLERIGEYVEAASCR